MHHFTFLCSTSSMPPSSFSLFTSFHLSIMPVKSHLFTFTLLASAVPYIPSLSPFASSPPRPLWDRSSVLLRIPALADVPQPDPLHPVDIVCHNTTGSLALHSRRADSLPSGFCLFPYLHLSRFQCIPGSNSVSKE